MVIKGILIVLTSLAVLVWLLRRIAIRRAGGETTNRASADQTEQAGQGSNLPKKREEGASEIDDSMAAEIVTTWNLLNPP
jgi:hypothetical protein